MYIVVISKDETWAFIAEVEILLKKTFRYGCIIKEIYINSFNSENDYKDSKEGDHIEIHSLFLQETKEETIKSILIR